MENKNIFTAMILFGVIMMASQYFFPPVPPQPDFVPSVETVVTDPVKPVLIEKVAVVPESVADTKQLPTESSSQNLEEKVVTVNNKFYELQLDTRGATILNVSLNDYKNDNTPESESFSVISSEKNGQSVLGITGNGSIAFDDQMIFSTNAPAVSSINSPTKISFSRLLPSGITLIKEYGFYPDSYKIDLNVILINKGSERLKGSFSLNLPTKVEEDDSITTFEFRGPVTLAGEELNKDSADDLSEGLKTYSKDVFWTGNIGKFFMTALIPEKNSIDKVTVSLEDSFTINSINAPLVELASGQQQRFSYTAYFGPKELDILSSIDPSLEKSIDFGFFAIIAHPLFTGLKYFYGFLGNYGLAIILLTIIIKLVFWPLTHKSYASMKAMQKLGPEMQKLREKYKNDKTRMNQEVMELYKTNRVNPMGGCLPMLVQIPVFIALYNVLLNAIELRHAPFYFWITDLSVKDPYYITPLVMGASMFLQQKMNPSQASMDPNMAKMMMFMPVIFTFMFLNFPAGLVIYWLMNNLLSILQQYMINRSANV